MPASGLTGVGGAGVGGGGGGGSEWTTVTLASDFEFAATGSYAAITGLELPAVVGRVYEVWFVFEVANKAGSTASIYNCFINTDTAGSTDKHAFDVSLPGSDTAAEYGMSYGTVVGASSPQLAAGTSIRYAAHVTVLGFSADSTVKFRIQGSVGPGAATGVVKAGSRMLWREIA